MELHRLLSTVRRVAKKIKPLRAHFRPLLDPKDGVLVAGRLAVVGTKKERTKVNRDRLRALVSAKEFEALLEDVSYLEIDVKPAIQLARKSDEEAPGEREQ
jgi:hypothetical protein